MSDLTECDATKFGIVAGSKSVNGEQLAKCHTNAKRSFSEYLDGQLSDAEVGTDDSTEDPDPHRWLAQLIEDTTSKLKQKVGRGKGKSKVKKNPDMQVGAAVSQTTTMLLLPLFFLPLFFSPLFFLIFFSPSFFFFLGDWVYAASTDRP